MKDLTDLCGDDPVALRLIELAEAYRDTNPADDAGLAEAERDALIAVGRRDPAAHADFVCLVDQVNEWHSLDFEPQRPGIDHDMWQADGEILYCLFRLMHGCAPCKTSAERHDTVGALHPTRPGWPSCGCEHAAAVA